MLRDVEYVECANEGEETNEKLNVLIMQLDSVSFNHFRRVFPVTFDYLTNVLENNVILDDYNVVGEKTYPNVLPLLSGVLVEKNLLSGLNQSEMDFFRLLDSTYHDQVPFIWRQYENLGYLSAYSEDNAPMGIFNLIKNGFRYPPTHFYAQPYWFKYQKLLSDVPCHFQVPCYAQHFNLLDTFMNQMNKINSNKKLPFFSFNFLKCHTHDDLAIPYGFDTHLKQFIERFESQGFLDNTLFILLGDHGNRLSRYFAETEQGKVEHTKPFLSIRVPRKLWSSKYFRNLQINRHKLITPFDIHKTLKHFFYLNKNGFGNGLSKNCRKKFQEQNESLRGERGISLFEKIKSQRSCREALIPNNYCACNQKVSLNETIFRKETNYTFNSLKPIILGLINDVTRSQRALCRPFEFKKFIESNKLFIDRSTAFFYQFQVLLEPGNAIFKITLQKARDENEFRVIDSIIRISLYKSQSHCLNDHQLHGFCFCYQQK
jgi:hypothetical protein